ncbi:hypothetical protein CYMTET_53086, partial [Cymbomonas tetramitiformis]
EAGCTQASGSTKAGYKRDREVQIGPLRVGEVCSSGTWGAERDCILGVEVCREGIYNAGLGDAGETKYSEAVDMWALGCIFGELLKQEPIFPGKVEAHMLELIANLLGSPNERIWPGGLRLPNSSTFKFPHQPYNYVQQQFPKLSTSGRDLLNKLLTYDPRKRITAEEAMTHPYFSEAPLPKPQDAMPTFPTAHDSGPLAGRATTGSNVDKKLGHAGVGGAIGLSSTQKRKITLRPDRVSSSQAPPVQSLELVLGWRISGIIGGSLVPGLDLARGVRIGRVAVAPWTSGARRAGRMVGIGTPAKVGGSATLSLSLSLCGQYSGEAFGSEPVARHLEPSVPGSPWDPTTGARSTGERKWSRVSGGARVEL